METYNQSYPEPDYTNKSIFQQVLEVSQTTKFNLAEAAKWAKFLGVISAVFIVLLFAVGIFFMVQPSASLNSLADFQNLDEFGIDSRTLIVLVYFIPALISVYPTWTFLRFGTLTRKGIRNENQAQFDKGLAYLKKSLKFAGVLVIIMIIFYIIGIVAMAVGIGISGSL